MSKRFAWLLGIAVLVFIGLLVACGNKYNPSSDGLVLVTSQGSGLLETFSFSLNNGSIFAVNNPPNDTANQVCVLNAIPSAIVADPAGKYAYTILTANTSDCGTGSTTTGIATFKINSDGTMTLSGSIVPDPNPIALLMDSTGKYLFVAEGVQYPHVVSGSGVNSYAIGSGGTLTSVTSFKPTLPTGMGFQPPNITAIAATPMVLPSEINGVQQAVCSAGINTSPTSEYLYAADAVNNVVWELSVDPTTGALSNPAGNPYFPSPPSLGNPGPPLVVPMGVAVDPCNRFVYVSNFLTNNIAAFTICNGSSTQSSTNCPKIPDGSLNSVDTSPFNLIGGANGPGPMVVDPFANYVYVLDTLSSQVSTLHISPVTGSLTAGSPAVVATGQYPTSLAIRADDNWLFVANFQSNSISQYSITPSTGALFALPVTTTDNSPWGVAVK